MAGAAGQDEAKLGRFIATLMFWLAVGALASPALALDPIRTLSQYKHSRLTVDDNAPSDVRALAQTPDGDLWIGAATGLFRFDGVNFEAMPGLGSKLDDHSVTALFVDRSAAMWIGYGSGKIGVLRGRRQIDVSSPLNKRGVAAFGQDKAGAIWA